MADTQLPDKSFDIAQDDRPHDHCGVAGAFAPHGVNVSNVVIEIGKALQHRGQNGGGIAVKAKGKMIKVFKKARAFNEIFQSVDVVEENSLRGEIVIAHLRYPTEGNSRLHCDTQPFYVSYKGWELALGHNGNIVEIKKHRAKLAKFGVETESDSDSEILAWLIVTAPGITWKQKIASALSGVKGAYSLVMLTGDDKLMALRDPWGVRPLVWTQDNGHVFIASETCGLDRINVRHNERLLPGQLLIADSDGVSMSLYTQPQKRSFCVFERLYFSHETSYWGGTIGENRERLGEELAKEEIERINKGKIKKEVVEKIDYVVSVPDTAAPGAHAFYEKLKRDLDLDFSGFKLTYKRGLVKERYDYAKRTFIEDDPYLRKKDVEKKFFISPSIIGKSIYLVDDTAVRLTTFSILVSHLLKIGVKEIHCRFLAPPFIHPCFVGVNIGSRDELGAVKKDKYGKYQALTEEEIKRKLKVTSLHYLSMGGMATSLKKTLPQLHNSYCTGCLDYNNPFDMCPYDPEHAKTPYIKRPAVKSKVSANRQNLTQIP